MKIILLWLRNRGGWGRKTSLKDTSKQGISICKAKLEMKAGSNNTIVKFRQKKIQQGEGNSHTGSANSEVSIIFEIARLEREGLSSPAKRCKIHSKRDPADL